MSTTTTNPTRRYLDTRIDVKLVLSALWTTMVLVFAYVDIFGFYRADVLDAALDGRIATTALEVDQTFLIATLGYILIPTLMVTLSLVLRPRVNRIVTMIVALAYVLAIIVSCVGETWSYYLAGSAVEILLLIAIIRTASTWPTSESGSTQSH